MPGQYVWPVWSSAFLVPWLGAYVAFPRHRKAMVWASPMAAPLGLTEPLFVPHYWNPPSLFDLARRSGFDIESVIFSFAIGGMGAVLYNLLAGRALLPVSAADRHSPRHKCIIGRSPLHSCRFRSCTCFGGTRSTPPSSP